MQKSRFKKTIIILIGALLSTIFAFSVGFTFANINLLRNYGTNPNSATAFMGNNQYVINNDTTTSPIAYSVGSHSTEISMQYAMDYEFDLRIKYTLNWLGDETLGKQLSTNNVKLLFANRDNVVVDSNYIYFINYKNETELVGGAQTETRVPCGLPAGEGKISLIAGVEIIETYNDEYKGKSLEISITEVKIAKTGSGDYSSDSHYLYVNTPAGYIWRKHKTNLNSSYAYYMLYNDRYNVANGVSYPGHTSAYSKIGDDSITGNWLGGNRAYGGIGIYVVTGRNPLKLTAQIRGTWQDNENSQSAGLQFDNSIRFNYAEGWKHLSYDENKLFETCYYEYEIPAHTACYIDIVESVEITCAHNVAHNNFDAYSLVAFETTINNTIIETSKIQVGYISNSAPGGFETIGTYQQKDIAVVNTNKYANNMYEYKLGSKVVQNFNNSTITLINNTSEEKQVEVDYSCKYYVSNGAHLLVLTESEERATQFSDGAYFRYDDEVNDAGCTLPSLTTYVIPAYSSLNIDSDYSVNGSFQTYKLINELDRRDAWVELNVGIDTVDVAESSNLAVEIGIKNSRASVSVKNNTEKVVNSINGTIKLYNYKLVLDDVAEPNRPSDWDATFWRYYSIDAGKPVQNESKVWAGGVFYKGSYIANKIQLYNLDGSEDENDGEIALTGLSLKPNESVEVFTFNIDSNSEILNESTVTGEGNVASGLEMVKSVTNPYLINYSNESYFVRLLGQIPIGQTLKHSIVVGNYVYLTKVIHPGEIFEIPSTISGITTISASEDYEAGAAGTLQGWDAEIINIFDLYFT